MITKPIQVQLRRSVRLGAPTCDRIPAGTKGRILPDGQVELRTSYGTIRADVPHSDLLVCRKKGGKLKRRLYDREPRPLPGPVIRLGGGWPCLVLKDRYQGKPSRFPGGGPDLAGLIRAQRASRLWWLEQQQREGCR